MREAELNFINLVGGNLMGADLVRADLRIADLRGANLSHAKLNYANLGRTNLNDADLTGSTFIDASLISASLIRANLRGANLKGVNLFGATIESCVLEQADFTEIKIGNTSFLNIDLRSVKGLETVRHINPSNIGFDTIYRSEFQIPEAFLRGCGVPNDLISRVLLSGSPRAEIDENAFTIAFHFPPAVRSSCEEYLLSFTRFLREVGVEATADLKHDTSTGKVLYSVKPAEGTHALGKIKQALELYLDLATVTNFGSGVQNDIGSEMIRLRIRSFQNEIENIQLQVRMREKTIEAQETTIQAQQNLLLTQGNAIARLSEFFTLAQQAALAEQEIEAKKTPDEIKVLGDTVEFGKAEIRAFGLNTGIKVSLPKLFEWCKRWMKEEDSKSNLVTYLQIATAKESGQSLPELPPGTSDSQKT